jgi:hypothetical protein
MDHRPSKRRPRSKRDDVIGVTSDGVRILRPVTTGKRNLTDRQIREIVQDLREAVAAARRAKRRERTPSDN